MYTADYKHTFATIANPSRRIHEVNTVSFAFLTIPVSHRVLEKQAACMRNAKRALPS